MVVILSRFQVLRVLLFIGADVIAEENSSGGEEKDNHYLLAIWKIQTTAYHSHGCHSLLWKHLPPVVLPLKRNVTPPQIEPPPSPFS